MIAKATGVRGAQQNNYSEAANQFAEACRLESSLKDVCYYQGRTLYYSNRFEEAIVPLQKSIAEGESAARAQSTMAQCLEALGKSAEAEQMHPRGREVMVIWAGIRSSQSESFLGIFLWGAETAIPAWECKPAQALSVSGKRLRRMLSCGWTCETEAGESN